MKLHATPCKLNFVEVYAPTSVANETEIDNFYNTLTEVLVHIPNSKVTIIQGDLNAKVGANYIEYNVAGKFKLVHAINVGKSQ